MLRSWNRTTEVGLFPDQVWLRQFQRFPKRPLQSWRWSGTAVSPMGGAQEILKRKLEGLIGSEQLTGVFSNHWFRFGILPWALQSSDDEQDRLLALAQIEATSPGTHLEIPMLPASALVALAPARFGRDRLFVVATPELGLALKDLLQAGLTIDHWQPWALTALEKLNGSLPSSCLLAVLEDGMATFLHCQSGWPEEIHTRRFEAGDTRSLTSLLRTEALRTHLPLLICPDALPFQLPGEFYSEGKVSGGLLAGLPATAHASAPTTDLHAEDLAK